MMASKGEIWVVDLNPQKRRNEVGKVRPAMIVQSDVLNHEGAYPNIIVMPLTTVLIDKAEPLRLRITRRGNLKKDSDLLIGQIRAIDRSRLIEKVETPDVGEMRTVRRFLDEILD